MKKTTFLFSIFFLTQNILLAQQAISYQAVARNSTGQIIRNQSVSIKFDMHQGSTSGTIVFTENQTTLTNQFGLFTLAIGSINTTQFQAINWANGPFHLEISMDPTGGSAYSFVGTQQLLSVPYALYARTAGTSVTPTININSPNTVNSSLPGTYSITVPPQTLSINSNSVSISNGNTIVLPPTATANTYTAGSGISLAGNIITNTAPDQPVYIVGPGVSGTYPNYTISSPPPVNITGPGVSGSSPNFTISSPPVVTLTGTGLTTVTNSAPNYTVNVPTPVLGFNNSTGTYSYTQGAYSNTLNLSPNTAFGAGTLTVGSFTTLIPGTGIWNRSTPYVSLVNIADNVGIGISAPTEKLVVSGNVAIPAANQYKYATPKTRFYSMPALAFNTEGNYHRVNNSGGIYIIDGTSGVQGNFYGAVNLPDGATIITVDAYVLDNDGAAGHDMAYVQLWRQDGAIGSAFGNSVNMATTLGTSITSSTIVKLTTSSISSPIVDNAGYTYYLRIGSIQAAPNLILFKVVITYTIIGVE